MTYNDIKLSIPKCKPGHPVTVSAILSSSQMDEVKFDNQLFRPRMTIAETQYISVEVGGSATLYCIYNHHNSTYTWKRNGSLIHVADHSRYSVIIDGVLQIDNVTETDGGLYNCSAPAVYPNYGQQTRNAMIALTVYSESL